VVVGAGLAGILIATAFTEVNCDLAILERSPTAGGTWRHHGNAFSRVNSSEPSYRLVKRHRPNTNHSYRSEILSDVMKAIEQHKLTVHTNAEVGTVSCSQRSWVLVGRQAGSPFSVTSNMAVLCTNRRLGCPREVHIAGEDDFGSPIKRGLAGDVNGLHCAGQRTVVLGMGAFAIENMRTSFENGASHVVILCRRRGTVCPQIVDWTNFIRPFDDEFKRGAVGDAVVFAHWQRTYQSSGTAPPECWKEGALKPDGHTVSTSDIFFIAHHMRMLSTQLGEVEILLDGSIGTKAQERLEADLLIKCVGFDVNEGNELLLGRTQMRCIGLVERNLWLQVEPHLDTRFFNHPFGSSYLNATAFNTKLMMRYWRDRNLATRIIGTQLPRVRMNTFTVGLWEC